MNRSDRLKRNSRRWRLAGIAAFCIGAFLLYQKVYYETRDFYKENFQVFQSKMVDTPLSQTDEDLLEEAMFLMDRGEYWESISVLEELKHQSPALVQIAEWYKILSLIGLEEKGKAVEMLEYYVEQPDFDFKKGEALRLLKEY